MDFLNLLATTLVDPDCTTTGDEILDAINSGDYRQVCGESTISTGTAHVQKMEPSSDGITAPNFESLYPKRRRLNQIHSPDTNLMHLSDDVLAIILLYLIGGELPKITRPRQMQNLIRAYSFASTSIRARRIFVTHICQKIQLLDAIFPLHINEELRLTPRHVRPENIAFLCSNAGRSLRVIRIPGFKAIGEPNDEHQMFQLNRTQNMMSALAQNCSLLQEITFQDAGSLDNGIANLLFARNPGLKKIQVDIPGADFMSALTGSECAVEELILIRVQTTFLPGLRKFLSGKGSSLRNLAIATCLPLDPDFEANTANKARCRRREKTFIEGLEKLTRNKMTSLRTLFLRPDRRAAWFKNFISRYQLLGQANLIIGDSKTFYPAATNTSIEPPKPRFHLLSLDQLLICNTAEMFNEYVNRLHEPDTLSIMRSTFTYAYGPRQNERLEESVKTIICRKAEGVKRLLIVTPIPRKQMFDMFLETIKEVLNVMEEKFKSLHQIEELRIPIHVVTFLAQGIGYEEFLARLANLKVLHFVKPQIQPEVTAQVPRDIPMFLREIMNVCPLLESIYISSGDCTKMRASEDSATLAFAIEDAMIALNEYEEAYQSVDVWTLRRQLTMWARDMVPKLREALQGG